MSENLSGRLGSSTSQVASFELAQKWIVQCRENRVSFSGATKGVSWFPIRIINVGNDLQAGSARSGVYNPKSLLGFCAHQKFEYPNSCKFSTDIRMGAISAHVSRCNHDYSPAVLSFLVDRFAVLYPGFCRGLEKGVQRYGKDIQKFSRNNCSYWVC